MPGPEQSRRLDRWRIVLVETLARWRRREIEKIVERAMTISLGARNLRRALSAWILILTPGAASKLPEKLERVRGVLETKLRVRYRMVWRIPARELLDMERESVLPLVPLSDHTVVELEEAIDRLREHDDEEPISQFLVHARMRYIVRGSCEVRQDARETHTGVAGRDQGGEGPPQEGQEGRPPGGPGEGSGEGPTDWHS
jgi:hypothetical protein